MNNKKYFIIIMGTFIYIFIIIGQQRIPIEELEIISGVGYDIERKGENMVEYILPISTNIYKSNGQRASLMFIERGKNIGEAIQKRQEKTSKKFIQGQERIILISEEYAKYGLKTLIEDRFRNAEVNDMAYMAVCKGKPETYLKYKVKGYSNSSEYMAGLIEASVNYSFFADNYKLIDAYVRVDAEGRSLALPYVEITKDGIKITNMAIFNQDKMTAKVNEANSKNLNLLKNDNVKGTESLLKSSSQYIDFDGKTTKRKVKCSKNGDKYSFTIDLALKGTIVNNGMYPQIIKDIKERKKFEEDMAENIEKQCYDFLNIMQNEYKVDCIELGKEAVTKFGRHKKVDWNEVVSNADIKVNVKVKVDLQGRGEY